MHSLDNLRQPLITLWLIKVSLTHSVHFHTAPPPPPPRLLPGPFLFPFCFLSYSLLPMLLMPFRCPSSYSLLLPLLLCLPMPLHPCPPLLLLPCSPLLLLLCLTISPFYALPLLLFLCPSPASPPMPLTTLRPVLLLPRPLCPSPNTPSSQTIQSPC